MKFALPSLLQTLLLEATLLLVTAQTLPAAVRTWTGAGPDGNWSTAANWQASMGPGAGDDLVFPAGAAGTVNTNNFGSATWFNSITVGASYILGGSPVVVESYVLSSAAVGTVIWNAPLRLRNSATIRLTGGAGLVLAGGLQLNGFDVILRHTGAAAAGFTVSGVISGTGNLFFDGTQTVTLSGGQPNTYAGSAVVTGGTVVLDKSADPAVTGSLNIGDAGSGTDTVRLLRSRQLASSSTVALRASARLEFGAPDLLQTLAGLNLLGGTWAGRDDGMLYLAGNLAATAGNSIVEGPVTFTNTIRDWSVSGLATVEARGNVTTDFPAGLELRFMGEGRTILQGGLTLGMARIESGIVEFHGNSPMTDVALSGGVLSGSGTVRDVDNRSLSGILAPGPGTKTFRCRNLILEGALRMEIGGQLPSERDWIQCSGFIQLGYQALPELRLSWVNGFGPSVGHAFQLIENSGNLPISGRFIGLDHGDSITIGSRLAEVSYQYGGPGGFFRSFGIFVEEVFPTGVDRVWSAAPADSPLWSGLTSWRVGTVPVQGDELHFPAGSLSLTPVNDLQSGSSFAGLTTEGGYTFRGNRWLVGANGIQVVSGPSPATFRFDEIRLSRDTTFSVEESGRMILNGPVHTAGHVLTLRAAASGKAFDIDDPISGGGEVHKTGAGLAYADGLLDVDLVHVSEGVLQLNGDTGTSPIQVSGTGILAADGTAGNITITGGTVRPGRIDGLVATPGTLSAGSCQFHSTASLSIQMQGAEPGSGTAQLVVGGSLDLADATLDAFLVSGFAPAVGTALVIVSNDATDAIRDTFRGLPEGAIFAIRAGGASALVFSISYRGGDGNDVTLRRVAVPRVEFRHSTGYSIGWIPPDGPEFPHPVFYVLARGIPGLTYEIEYTDALHSGPWWRLNTGNPVIGAANGDIAFYDYTAWGHPRRFYRIVAPD